MNKRLNKSTSWDKVSGWYEKAVGKDGHYFHQNIVIPKSLALLDLKSTSSLLDVACGQGILSRYVRKDVRYIGVDNSPQLVQLARKHSSNPRQSFVVADATNAIPVTDKFTHASIILGLQNIREPAKAIHLIGERLTPGGKLLLVLNHPCFRIPRQSSWEIDKNNKLQYRRINRYMTPLEVPINMHPGRDNLSITWTFHHPISDYSKHIRNEGMLIDTIEEWTSDKESEGKAAKMENRGREEFPLFMAILATKI